MIHRDRQTATAEQRLRAELRRGDPGAGEALTPREASAMRRALLAAASAALAGGRRRGARRARTVLAAAAASAAAALFLLAVLAVLTWRQLPRPETVGARRTPPAPAVAALPPRGQAVAAARSPLAASAVVAAVPAPDRRGRLGHAPGGSPGHPAGRGGAGRAASVPATVAVMPAAAGGAPGERAEGLPGDVASGGMSDTEQQAAAALAEMPRQVQFSTKGGTRVIWLVRPESSR
jgi:hypothetical protein